MNKTTKTSFSFEEFILVRKRKQKSEKLSYFSRISDIKIFTNESNCLHHKATNSCLMISFNEPIQNPNAFKNEF
jgi:hypothetical protein